MPRQTINRPDPVQLQPAAAPIGTSVSVGRGVVGESPAEALARGLGSLNQGVQPFLMNRMDEATLDEVKLQQQAAEQELRNTENRKAFRDAVVSGAILPEQNPHKLRHMKILAGQYDAEAYAQALEASQFDKDGKLVKPHRTTDELNTFLGESRKPFDGITDPDMKSGFLAGAERAEAKFKATQQARRMQELELTHQLVMEDATDRLLMKGVPLGKAPSPAFYANAATLLDSYADVEGPVGRTRMNEQFIQSVVSYAKATQNVELLKDFAAKAEASGVRVSTAHKSAIAAAQDSILDDSEREKSLKYSNEQREMRRVVNQVLASGVSSGGPLNWKSAQETLSGAFPNHTTEVLALVRQAENSLNPPDEKQEKAHALYQSTLSDSIERIAPTNPNEARKLLTATLKDMDIDPATRARLHSLGVNHINEISNFRAQSVNLRSAEERNIQRSAEDLADAAIRDGVTVSSASEYLTADRLASVGLTSQDRDTSVFNRAFRPALRAAAHERFGEENRDALKRGAETAAFGTPSEAAQRFAQHLRDGEITPQERDALTAKYADTFQAVSLLDTRAVPEYTLIREQFQAEINLRSSRELSLLEGEAQMSKDPTELNAKRARIALDSATLWDTTTRGIADKNVALAKAGKITPDEMLTKTRDEIRQWVQSRAAPKTASAKSPAAQQDAAMKLGVDGIPRVDAIAKIKQISQAAKMDPNNPVKSVLMQLAYEAEQTPWVGPFDPDSLQQAESDLDLVLPRGEDRQGGGVFSRQTPLEAVRPLGRLLSRDSVSFPSPDDEESHHQAIIAVSEQLRPKRSVVSETAQKNIEVLVAAARHEKPEAAALKRGDFQKGEYGESQWVPAGTPSEMPSIDNLLRLKDLPVLGMQTDAQVRSFMAENLKVSLDKISGDHVDSFRIMTRIARTNEAIDSVRGMSVAEAIDKNVDLSTAFIRASDRQITAAIPKLAAKHFGVQQATPEQMSQLYSDIVVNRNKKLGRESGSNGESGQQGTRGSAGSQQEVRHTDDAGASDLKTVTVEAPEGSYVMPAPAAYRYRKDITLEAAATEVGLQLGEMKVEQESILRGAKSISEREAERDATDSPAAKRVWDREIAVERTRVAKSLRRVHLLNAAITADADVLLAERNKLQKMDSGSPEFKEQQADVKFLEETVGIKNHTTNQKGI